MRPRGAPKLGRPKRLADGARMWSTRLDPETRRQLGRLVKAWAMDASRVVRDLIRQAHADLTDGGHGPPNAPAGKTTRT